MPHELEGGGYNTDHECALCAELKENQDDDIDEALASDSDIPLIEATMSNWLRSAPLVEGNGYTFSPMGGVLTISTDTGFKAWWNDGQVAANTVKELVFEEGVTEIAATMNSYNLSATLTSVTIPGSVQTIGMFAFAWCSNLTTVTIGEGVPSIGGSMFSGCSKLKTINLPFSVTRIEDFAFQNCSSLESVVIPPKATYIGLSAFSGCRKLSEITFMGNGDTYLSIQSNAFNNVATNGTIYYPKGTSAPSSNVPPRSRWPRVESTEMITGDGYRFDPTAGKLTITEYEGASNWRSDGMIPNKNLLSVEVMEKATKIKNSAFQNKNFLKSAVIGEQVEIMGERLFYNDPALTELIFKGNIPDLHVNTFSGIGSNSGTVRCPSWAPGYDEAWLRSVGLTNWTLESKGGPISVPLELHNKVSFGGYDWWVIGLNGDGVYSRPGNMTLLAADASPDLTAFGADSQYEGSDLEGAMNEFYENFPESGKSRILPRPSFDDVSAGGILDGTLTGRRYVWPLSKAEAGNIPQSCLLYDGDWWLRSAAGANEADVIHITDQTASQGQDGVDNSLLVRPAMVTNLNSTVFLTAEAGEGGNIKPSGAVMVEEGGEQTFDITAEEGYLIDDVLVNGESAGAVSSYTLSEITEEASIEAKFLKKTYTIEVNPTELDFGSHTEGYAAPATRTVTVRNAGNQSITLEQPALSGQNQPMAYETGELSRMILASGEEAQFTVRPVAGLPVGTYTETVSITGTENASASVSLTFKVTEKPVYTVTVDSSSGGSASASPTSAEAGELITLTYLPDTGFHFKGWEVQDGGVTIENNQFVMPAVNVTVRAIFEQDEKKEESKPASSDSGNVSEPQVSYNISGDSISLSVSDLRRLADTGRSLNIKGDKVQMTFGPAAIRAILMAASAADGGSGAGNTVREVVFSAVPAELSGSPAAEALVGGRPVYDFTIGFKNGAGGVTVQTMEFPAGSVFISLDYTPAEGENKGSLFMIYIGDNGDVSWINNSFYSESDTQSGIPKGQMKAAPGHFSKYGVAYKAPAPIFADTAEHWAREDIVFVAARGLITGTGDGRFSPDAAMTRGELVTALGRLAGVNPADYPARSFTDVPADAHYAPYIEWAAQAGIAGGTDGLFRPDVSATREETAVMLANYAVHTNASLPLPYAVPVCSDSDAVSPWATKEAAAMLSAGLLKNRDDGRFEPQAPVTRAETAAALHRFVEMAVDPDAKWN